MSNHPKAVPFLEKLNIFGLSRLDPVFLAALADERPLLLIGPHGCAKSELLNRLAQALGLEHRHYNASLVSFDDLVGFPVPDACGNALKYLQTPATIWNAESVFLDEIARCRPEHQNKLFSIVHERRIQGQLLEKLRYRWSAINPPPSEDAYAVDADVYTGSLPLDPALADRFCYVIELPPFESFSVEVRKQILKYGGALPPETDAVVPLIEETHARIQIVQETHWEWITAYVNALVVPLCEAGLSISGRRAVALAGAIGSVEAASQVLGCHTQLEAAAFLALTCGLPQRAQGKNIDDLKLRAVHRAAIQCADISSSRIWLQIREERDPVRRVAIAFEQSAEEVGKADFSQLVSDAFAGLSVPQRWIFARAVLPALAAADRVTAATYEMLVEPIQKVQRFVEKDQHIVRRMAGRGRQWREIDAQIQRLQPDGGASVVSLANVLQALFVMETVPFDPQELVLLEKHWSQLFAPYCHVRCN